MLRRKRIQLGGALLIGALLPFGIGALVSPGNAHLPLFEASFLGAATAIILGYYFLQTLTVFPGTFSVSHYVVPEFTATFGTIFVAFFLARIQYSRPLLISSYLSTILWFLFVFVSLQRRQRLMFAVVPFGRTDTLPTLHKVHWQALDHPGMPKGCNGVVADFEHELPSEWEELLAECALHDIPVFHFKQLRQSLTGQVEIEHLSENSFGSLIPNHSFLAVKLWIDVVVAGVALVMLLPLFAAVAVSIKLDARGPVFFRQRRIGYRGRDFFVWKFRTMTAERSDVEANVMDARLTAITRSGDSRITRLGRHLRRTRIDELPQLLNVVKGEMSLIGPRPEAHILSAWYQAEIPFYRYRHIVRPGISGWAQVRQGHVAEIDDILKKLSYDFFYIANFSLWLDIAIILKTIKTMLTGFGSR